MSVSEFERHQLFQWFEEAMGPERSATMMQLVPPVGWADVATRADLKRLEERFEHLELRFEARLQGELRKQTLTMVTANTTVVGLLIALSTILTR